MTHTKDMETVSVDLAGRPYDILVGTELIARAGLLLQPLLPRRKTVIVTDAVVADRHLAHLHQSLAAAGISATDIILEPGDDHKNFDALEDLIDQLLEARVERQDKIIALGGGVIGDMTGLAASLVRRGVDFIQIPTTLLAQVDSSVGGKTGVNSRHGKNLIGTFHQPRLVIADTTVLDTLSNRQILAGYAEIVKYGLLGDGKFFAWLETNGRSLINGDASARQQAIVRSCKMKAEIVARDEHETGDRALLNLGHTFGHALETAHGYSPELLHGEAVAIGMVAALALSEDIGLLKSGNRLRVERHLRAVGLRTRPFGADPEELLELMRQDKKVLDDKMTFVVLEDIGRAVLRRDIPDSAVLGVLSRLMSSDGIAPSDLSG